MTSLKDALGRSVVARDTAETLGQLRGAVVDPATRRVVALQVGKGRGARLVDWSALTGVGPDAVVVDTESALREAGEGREERIVKGDIPLLGGRVLTDRGDELGTLDDVELDDSTGEVVALVAGEVTIAAADLRAIGGYAVVVHHDPVAPA